MAKNKRASKGKSKEDNTSNEKKTPVEVKEPFALVLYDVGGKGVVETKKIPKKSRQVGESCLVPNPIDFLEAGQENSEADKKFKAKIIRFGYHIDFLYELKLCTDGSILNPNLEQPKEQELAAKRSKEAENNAKKRKERNIIDVDATTSELPFLFSKNHVQGDQVDNTSETKSSVMGYLGLSENNDKQERESGKLSEESVQNLEQSDSLQDSLRQNTMHITHDEYSSQPTTSSAKPNFRSPFTNSRDLFPLEMLDSSSSRKPDEEQSSTLQASTCGDGDKPFKSSLDDTPQDKSSSNNETDDQSSNQDESIISAPQPLFPFAKCPSNCDNCPFLQEIYKGTESEQNYLKRVLDAAASHQLLGNINQNDQMQPKNAVSKLSRSLFPCLSPSENTFALVSGLNVYCKKFEMMALPPIEGQQVAADFIGQEAVPIRTMVNLLVDMIVDKKLLQESTITYSHLPDEIPKAIRSYINMRLPEQSRKTAGLLNSYITDRCRSFARDRVGEAKRRQEKMETGIQPKKKQKKQ